MNVRAPEGPDEVALPGASGGGDVRAEDRGELDRVYPYAAGPALDQDAFARLQAGLVGQRLPGRKRGQRQRRGLRVGYRARPAARSAAGTVT